MSETLYLAHHGIKGMKWGVRRFQNEDGSLNAAGEKRYQKNMRRAEKSYSRELRYRNKAAKYQAKADSYAQKRDKAKSRWFQTDVSIAKAERFDRKRARQEVKARRYSAKADKAARRADKWLSKNEHLMSASASSATVSSSTKSQVDEFIKKNS